LKLDQALPKPEDILTSDVAGSGLRRVQFDSRALADLDTGLLVFLRDLGRIAAERHVDIDREGLSEVISAAW
jgi:hypothetical protein